MMNFQTVNDVLEFAVALEQASQKFYGRLAEQTQSTAVGHFLRKMVEEERLHEAQIRQLLAEGSEILDNEISSEEMDRYIDAMNIPEPLDYKEAVKIARDKENASRMLYTILAGQVDQPEVADILSRLALQEQRHHAFFVQEYRRICVGEN